jgi:hypothetical protein
MNLYIFFIIIVLSIIALFILFRIFLKKDLKSTLFNGILFSMVIPSQRNTGLGNYSSPKVTYEDSIDKGKDKKQNLSSSKKSFFKSPFNKADEEQALIPSKAEGKFEPKEKSTNLVKNESVNKSFIKANVSSEFKINSFETIYNFFGNSGISDIVHYFEVNNIQLINPRDIDKRISSSVDFEEAIKDRIIDFLNNQYEDVKNKISEFRKNGKDLKDAEFILFSVPLKIKIFSSNFTKKDFEVVIKKIESIKQILKNCK